MQPVTRTFGRHLRTALAFALAAALPMTLGGCKQEVRLTGAPMVGVRPPPAVTPTQVFLDHALALPALLAAAERTLPETLARTTVWLDAARCRAATDPRACASARVEVNVTRAGAVRLLVVDRRLVLEMPAQVTIRTRTAAGVSDARSETMRLRATAAVGADGEMNLSVKMDNAASDRFSHVAAFGISLALGPLPALDRRLSEAFAAVEAAMRALAPASVITAQAGRAWQAMLEPIRVAGAQQRWLVLAPRRVRLVGMTGSEESAALRLAFTVEARLVEDEQPAPLPVRPMPAIEPAAEIDPNSRLVVVRTLPYTILERALAAQLPASDRFLAVVEKSQLNLAARPRSVRLYPAFDRLGIELQLDIDEPSEFRGRVATMHLAARPDVRIATATLGFTSVEPLPAPAAAAGRTVRPAAPPDALKAGPGVLAEAPLVRRLAGAEAGIARLLDGVEKGMGLEAEHRLASGFTLSASFGHATLDGVLPGLHGLEMRVALTGSLLLKPFPAAAQQVRNPLEGSIR